MAVIIPIVSKFDDKGIKKSQSAFAGLSKSLKGIVAGLGITASFAGIASALEAASKAAVSDTKSQALLATQLRNTAGASDTAIAASEEFIRSLMMQTSIADDSLRPALSTLVRATGDVSKAQDLLALSTDIAAGTGKDLSAVSIAVGKAAAGQTTALFKLIPSLKGSSDFAADAAVQFKGMASAAANNDPYQRMNIVLGEIQETVGMALLPSLNDFSDWLSSPGTQEAIAYLISQFTDMVTEMRNASDGAIVLVDELTALIDLDPDTSKSLWDGFFNGLGDSAKRLALGPLAKVYDLLAVIGKFKNAQDAALANQSDETSRLLQRRLDKFVVPTEVETKGTGGSTKVATDYVAGFYKNIADEASKQRASAQLAGLGLSKGLVDSIIGSQDWRKVFIKVKNSGGAALSQLQGDFNKTATGAQELADEIQKIADYNASVAELEATRVADIADATAQLTDQANAAIQQNNDQLAQFEQMARDTLSASIKTLNAYRNLGNTIDMGQFESEIMSAFDNVKSGLESALANKTITQEAYRNLLDFATKENQALAKIGRQRDELAKKKSLVEALMGDVKSSIMGFANINQIAQATAQTVTETTSRIVNGLTVETKRTFETTKAGNSVADNFKAMIEKARNFVSILKTLKQQGLNADLFKQIVDAGVEAGTATAEGILAGGPQSITEINDLFGELQTISEDAAETTAVVMYNNGQDVVGGFLNGLVSQDEALKTLAQGMADSFATSFELSLMVAIEAAINAAKAAAEAANAALMAQLQAQIASAIAAVNAQYASALAALNASSQLPNLAEADKTMSGTQTLRLGDIKLGDFGTANSALAQKLIASPKATAWNTSITINAGMGTDGKSVGQLITAELNKFAKANGIKVN